MKRTMTRGWRDYWDWKDKPVKECGVAKNILEAAKVKISDLRSRVDDPPDCEAFLDNQWSGIEVSELVHRQTLKQNIRAKRNCKQGRVLSGAFIDWPRDCLLAAIQARIDAKDVDKVKGGPYKRYVLVLHTAEEFLYREHVQECLDAAKFRTGFITDVFFGLDYHTGDPVTEEGRGIPVFRLRLVRR